MNDITPPKTKRPKKYWIASVIVLLVFINIVNFISLDASARLWRSFRYSFDSRFWPSWYSLYLWLLAVGFLAEYLLRIPKYQIRFNEEIRHIRNRTLAEPYRFNRYSKIVIKTTGITILAVALVHLGFFSSYTYLFLHHVFEPFYYIPLIDYFLYGSVSWRLIFAPMTAFISIVLLLRYNARMKKKRRDVHEK